METWDSDRFNNMCFVKIRQSFDYKILESIL